MSRSIFISIYLVYWKFSLLSVYILWGKEKDYLGVSCSTLAESRRIFKCALQAVPLGWKEPVFRAHLSRKDVGTPKGHWNVSHDHWGDAATERGSQRTQKQGGKARETQKRGSLAQSQPKRTGAVSAINHQDPQKEAGIQTVKRPHIESQACSCWGYITIILFLSRKAWICGQNLLLLLYRLLTVRAHNLAGGAPYNAWAWSLSTNPSVGFRNCRVYGLCYYS